MNENGGVLIKVVGLAVVLIVILIGGWYVYSGSAPDPQAECEAQGGVWHIWSTYWQEEPACDMPFADGGVSCTDSADCSSALCIYMGEDPVVGAAGEGECASLQSASCVRYNFFVEGGEDN